MKALRMLGIASLVVAAVTGAVAQSWQRTTNNPPLNVGTMLLLTDGTVIAHQEDDQNGDVASLHWYKLTPDINGSYVNGTWTQIADLPTGYGPLFFGSAVLPDGRVVVEGGEYNQYGAGFTKLGAIYNPVTDSWTPVTAPTGWNNIGDASTAVPSGIRIKNGATLPAPMTLASPNPVYLQGDFNTAVDANGYPVKSSSIISDALTFQSNSWSDAANTGQRHSSSDNPLNQSGSYTIASEIPTASSTTYNTAFISGNTVSNYAAGQSTLLNPNQSGFSNGGLNNLPRFLEDWSGKTCTISGSMICLFNSQYATAPFSANHYLYHQGSGLSPSKPVNGSIYEPPTRNWGYNPNLMTSPPPFTPVVVSSVEAVYWIN